MRGSAAKREKIRNRVSQGGAHPDSGSKTSKKNNGFSIFFMKSLVIPYQSKIRDDKYTLPLKRKELSCTDFGTRFWQSPVNALRRKNVLWHRLAGKRSWLLRARPANLRKFVRLEFHRGPNPRNGNVFKCTLSYSKHTFLVEHMKYIEPLEYP